MSIFRWFMRKRADQVDLVDWARMRSRTLKDLEAKVDSVVNLVKSDETILRLEESMKQLETSSDTRALRDLYTSGLRSLSRVDLIQSVEFGEKHFTLAGDHRSQRTLIILHRRLGHAARPLELLNDYQGADHVWREEMVAQCKEDLSYEKMVEIWGEDWDAAAEISEEALLTLADEVIGQTSHLLDAHRFFYLRALRVYKDEEKRMANLVIHHGEAFLDIKKKDSGVAIQVADAYLFHGDIDAAIDSLERFGDTQNERVVNKLNSFKSFASLRDEGFNLLKPLSVKPYEPIEGKVLYLLHNSLPFNSGGYATRSHGLLRGVRGQGWDIHAVTRRGYPNDRKGLEDALGPDAEVIDGVPYHRLFEEVRGYGKVSLLTFMQEYAEHLAELVFQERPAVIHAASNHMNGNVANAVAKAFGIPSVYEVRGLWEITRISRQPEWRKSDYFQMMCRLEAQAANEASRAFTITKAVSSEMGRRGVDESHITILPNGVDTSRFTPRQRDEKLEFELGLKDKVVIGYIGTIVQYEGLDDLLHAAALLRDSGVGGFHLLIIGDGAVLEKIQGVAEELNLDDIVTFTGRVPHEEVESYYSVIDIAPFPRKALPVTEMVSPLKPFEAMAMGKAVLSSNVDALAEIVEHGLNGLLFQKDDIDDMAKQLERLIIDGELRTNLERQSRSWVVSNRDWKVISKRMAEIYGELAEVK